MAVGQIDLRPKQVGQYQEDHEVGQLVMPFYTLAGLPVDYKAGRTARVSTSPKGEWLDTGTGWVPAHGAPYWRAVATSAAPINLADATTTEVTLQLEASAGGISINAGNDVVVTYPGVYLLAAQVTFEVPGAAVTAASPVGLASIDIDGTQRAFGSITYLANHQGSASVPAMIYALNANSIVKLKVFQNTGNTQQYSGYPYETWLTGLWVGQG